MIKILTLSFFLIFAASITAQADGTIDISLSESTLQKGISKLSFAGMLPLKFGGKTGDHTFELNCLEPLIKFPDAAYDTDMSERIIARMVCSLNSPQYKIQITCPYQSLSDVPPTEFQNGQTHQCAHIQASILPNVEKQADGVIRFVLKSIAIEHLALIPNAQFPALAPKWSALETIALKHLNDSFKKVGNPWFQQLLPFPLELPKFKQVVNGTGATATEIQLSVERFWIDLSTKKFRTTIKAKTQAVTP